MTTLDTPDWAGSALTAGSNFELLNATVPVPATSGADSAVVAVANFETVIVQLTNIVNEAGSYQVQWYSDALATKLVYSERTYFTADINGWFNAFAVKAAYMLVFLFNDGGSTQTWQVVVNGCRAAAELSEVFPPQVLAEINATSVPASTQSNFAIQSAIPGPATLWAESAVVGVVGVQYWNGTTWISLVQVASNETGGAAVNFVIPGDEVRAFATNQTAGAGNFNFAITHGG